MIDLEELEDFVPIFDAILLREYGFDIETGQVYERNIIACRYEDYPKPTLQMAMKWLRIKYGIYIDVTTRISDNVDKDVCCTYHITWVQNRHVMHMYDGEYCCWEEAARFGLNKALTSVLPSLIKTNENK